VTPRARRLLAVVITIPILVYLFSFAAVALAGRLDQRRPVDAIVVLGAAQYNGKPSPVLRARLDQALILYREGLAPTVVVTGGIGEGDRVSEATVGRQYLVGHDVPDSAVVVRPEGRSTQASIKSVGQWAGEHGVHRVLLVSDPFHMLRLRLEARRTTLQAFTSPTRTSPISANWRSELFFFCAEAWKIPVVILAMPLKSAERSGRF
jgi:uncharacterized SAM-binding protein YcdF (DUF218 family)